MSDIKKLIKEVAEIANIEINSNKFPKNLDDKLFVDFLKEFFPTSSNHDFQNDKAGDLYNVALSSFRHFSSRKVKEIKVRVSNHNKKSSGFDSKNTIIDIVTDNMPFLVDSTVGYLDDHGIKIDKVIHPIYELKRDKLGKIIDVAGGTESSSKQESVIQIHIEKIESQTELDVIKENILKILNSVALVVGDFKNMVSLVQKAKEGINNADKIVNNIDEIKEFINWIIDGNLILLGAREFDIKKTLKGEYHLKEVDGSSFGVFNSSYDDMKPNVLNTSYEEVTESFKNPYVIEILKSRYRSKIHRIANAERIRIQKISKNGEVVGEIRLVGLFTSAAYNEPTDNIPLIRHKVEKVIRDSGYIKGSHDYKDLVSVLEFYPRDELFQISQEDLLKNSLGIVAITGRSQVRFFARKDKYSRFVTCLVYVPRTKHNSELRNKISSYLSEVYRGEVADYYIETNDSNLVRIYVIIRTNNDIPDVNELVVENEISQMTIDWTDSLHAELKEKFDNSKKISLFARYKNAFSISYKNRFNSTQGVADIEYIEQCINQNKTISNLYKSSKILSEDVVELKIYSPEKEIILSEIMPILESYGFNVIKEHTYVITVDDEKQNGTKKDVWMHYFNLNLSKGGHRFNEDIKNNFEENIDLVWQGVLKVGFLNRLVVGVDLSWKQIFMLHAYFRYLYQIGLRYENCYLAGILVKHQDIAKLVVEIFETKFDPKKKLKVEQRQKRVEELLTVIESKLANVDDLTEDTIIRRLFGTINATLRTNYYQEDGEGQFKGYMSFKFDCKKVPDLPLPVPHAEIFVYSANVQATHLRGGKVARGGLRWSDRFDDFRTEVLGLVKAQMTKNAVIVPVGSKGCFVVTSDLEGLTREEIQAKGIESYKTFLRGMLDVTDNIVNNKIKHPKNVIMYDEADPYLVVAADKGTATFSDIANSVSNDYGFWLGDAFASGGSQGYDHKKMGITAKGAWVSVKRHFAEKGHDTQTQDFTCVGIGDMGGDVFGNGMLLSKHIRLVAAFNHMHIFLDPNPDSAKSFKERQRMFNLSRSTWEDYDKKLISKGGGIYSRGLKSINISSEVKEVLDIEDSELSPTELIKAILKSPVDLLWNGGIGTYVKSESETNLEVGDRANDLLRVNGNELRCKVVGEGGNLGLTQRGRIEYALNGGAVNTDAIDNSAGVDCSDHEVNIKIALQSALKKKIISEKERNKILEDMTDEVSDLVLMDNNLQTQAVSITKYQKYDLLGEQSQFIERLEKSGLLNREIEFLPSKKEFENRKANRIGLTRPEICVILSYAKMDLYNKILSSDLVDDEYFENDLVSYFPNLMQKKFLNEIKSHQLKKEIIATQITNFVVNRVGISFISQISRDSGFGAVDVVKNFIIACDSFRLRETWENIENFDGQIDPEIQMQMFLGANKLIERSIVWLLRNNVKGSIRPCIEKFRKISDDLFKVFPKVLGKNSKESFERKVEFYCMKKVDKKVAIRVAAFDPTSSLFDIAQISFETKLDLETIARIYYEVGNRFSLKWLRGKVSKLETTNHWQKLSNKSILDDLYNCQQKIAKEIIDFNCKEKNVCSIESVEQWICKMQFLVNRYDKFIADLRSNSDQDLSIFIVALNRLKPLLS
ncbi:MAG: NAD-glutamate dehydrogenase [Rickettsiales bacterium]|nr:NAD-glutamate dehydrogenase [Rickettsiales bacterium]